MGLIAKRMPVLLRKCCEVYENLYRDRCELAYLIKYDSGLMKTLYACILQACGLKLSSLLEDCFYG